MTSHRKWKFPAKIGQERCFPERNVVQTWRVTNDAKAVAKKGTKNFCSFLFFLSRKNFMSKTLAILFFFLPSLVCVFSRIKLRCSKLFTNKQWNNNNQQRRSYVSCWNIEKKTHPALLWMRSKKKINILRNSGPRPCGRACEPECKEREKHTNKHLKLS